MSQCRPILTLGPATVLSCLLMAIWACSGGGGTGSSGPTAPVIADISGLWAGRNDVELATGCGCIGEEYAPADPNSLDHSPWEIFQNISLIQGNFFDFSGAGWCEITGTALDFLFSAEAVGCEQEEMHMECANGTPRDLVLKSLEWEGTFVGGNDIHGDWVGTWDCINSRNGTAAGVLTLSGPWRAVRL